MANESLSTISSQQGTHIIKQYFQPKMTAFFLLDATYIVHKKQNCMH